MWVLMLVLARASEEAEIDCQLSCSDVMVNCDAPTGTCGIENSGNDSQAQSDIGEKPEHKSDHNGSPKIR